MFWWNHNANNKYTSLKYCRQYYTICSMDVITTGRKKVHPNIHIDQRKDEAGYQHEYWLKVKKPNYKHKRKAKK